LNGFLGNVERTLFNVTVSYAVEIADFSVFPKEEEVLVFPCVTFEVQNVFSPADGLYIVQLKEMHPPSKLISGFENL